MVDNAKGEVVLDVRWLTVPGLHEALTAAAERGVRCYVGRRDPGLEHWTESKSVGFIASGGGADDLPAVLVADRSTAVRVESIRVRTAANCVLEFPVGTDVRATEDLCLAVCRGMEQDLARGDEHQLFAAFALSRNPAYWTEAVSRFPLTLDSVERAHLIHKWLKWARACDVDPPGDLFVRAWTTALQECTEDSAVTGLLTIADDIPPEDVLRYGAERVAPACVLADDAPLRELVGFALAVHRKWPGFDPAACPVFIDALRSCLSSDPDGASADCVQAAARVLSNTHRSGPWASWLAATFTLPTSAVALLDWLELHVPLAGRLSQQFRGTAIQVVSSHARGAAAYLPHIRSLWRQLRMDNNDLDRMFRPAAGSLNTGAQKGERR